MPRYTIRPFVVSLLLATTALAATSCAVRQNTSQPPPDVEQLKAAAMKGSLKDAEELSKLRDNPAILAMRDVLAKSDNVQVKIAMIEGLGHNNKDIETVAMFLDIMEKDDDLVELRAKANAAAEICGLPGRFYNPKNGYDDRLSLIKEMRDDHKKMKELKPGPTTQTRPMPQGKIYVRESIATPTYLLCLPFAENGLRMRVSPSHPQTANSYFLEIELRPAVSHWPWTWKDLVMRIDIQPDGNMVVTAVSAAISPYSFDLFDANGKLLVFDFGPNTNNTHTFADK